MRYPVMSDFEGLYLWKEKRFFRSAKTKNLGRDLNRPKNMFLLNSEKGVIIKKIISDFFIICLGILFCRL